MAKLNMFTVMGILTSAAWMTAALPGQAQTLVTCTGTVMMQFEPPVTPTPRQVTITTTANYPLCVTSTFPYIMSAVSIELQSPPEILTCGDLVSQVLSPFSEEDAFEMAINWSFGPDSILSALGTNTYVGTTFITNVEGDITSGQFAGAVATLQKVYPGVLQVLTCSDQGIEQVLGASVLTITP